MSWFAARQLLLPRGLMLILEANEATLSWETDRPYESVLTVPAGATAIVKGLKIRHRGKSVANNYAIYCSGGANSLWFEVKRDVLDMSTSQSWKLKATDRMWQATFRWRTVM